MPTFHTAEDSAREQATAAIIARKWEATVVHMGAYSPIDWLFERGEVVVGCAELKVRGIRWGQYPTIYLAYTKYLHLMVAYHHSDLPALFVVRALDRIMYVPVEEVPAAPVVLRGRPPRPGAVHDREPMIEVPCDLFRPVLW